MGPPVYVPVDFIILTEVAHLLSFLVPSPLTATLSFTPSCYPTCPLISSLFASREHLRHHAIMKISQKIQQSTKEGKVWWSFEYFPPRTAQVCFPFIRSKCQVGFLTSFSRDFKTFSTVSSACGLLDQSSSISPGVYRHLRHLLGKADTAVKECWGTDV